MSLRTFQLAKIKSVARRLPILAASLLLLTAPLTALAYTVSPLRVELAGDPGITLSSDFKVYNDTDQTQNFYTSVQNFEAQNETGNPVFVDSKSAPASWITPVPLMVAKPRQEVSIPFTITIPKDAEPGGYFAGIFASTVPPQNGVNNVQEGARVGTLLLLRVNGDIPEGISVLEFGLSNRARFVTRLPINFYYRFQNSGADRIKPLGDVIIKNVFGLTSKILNANRVDGNVLPKSIRRFETAWVSAHGDKKQPSAEMPPVQHLGFFAAALAEAQNFAFGPYVAHLNLAYGNTTAKGATASYMFFVIPWQLLIIVLILIFIVYLFARIFLRRYNRYIIAQAKTRQRKRTK